MKERVVLFSDAVIAIILTIMVLELPVDLHSGVINFPELFRGVGIYFISFCFVANLWFETAQSFNKVERVTNRDLVIYLLSLFFLSLVPMSTGLLIEDTNSQVMLIYGVLTLIVLLLTQFLIMSLTKQAIAEKKVEAYQIEVLKGRNRIDVGLRLTLLIIGHFFVQIGLVIYLILPIVSFLQNIVDREEDSLVKQMDGEQKEYYLQERGQVWGNPMKKYSHLLRNSLQEYQQNGERPDAQWWSQFNQQWEAQLAGQIQQTKERLANSNASERNHLEHELQKLTSEQEKFRKRVTMMQQNQERGFQRQQHKQQQQERHRKPKK
ncbi:TMEM175 family protein [Enterococcus sp. LJL120]